MKKLSQIINEAKKKLDIQDDTINYISTEDLIKYVEIANKFLSVDTKNIINWLIEQYDLADWAKCEVWVCDTLPREYLIIDHGEFIPTKISETTYE